MAVAPSLRRRRISFNPKVLGFAFSVAGYMLTAAIFWWGIGAGHFTIPSVDGSVWDRVGDEMRVGVSPYYHVDGFGGFYYAPP